MKVLHLDEQRTWRGGEQQASWLVRGLVSRGVECHVVGRPGSPWLGHEHPGEVRRLGLPLRGEWDLASAFRLAGYVRREGIDILHAHTSHAHTLAVIAGRIAGRGQVVAHRRVSFAPNRNPLTRWKYRNAARIACVSEAVARTLGEHGYQAPQVVTIHSSIDLARIDSAPAAERMGAGPVLFNAGALTPHKDHATLLDAFRIVLSEVPNARLVIAGEGELREELERRIASLGIGHAVSLLGHRDDVPSLMRAADLYVSSSWSEGLGTSVLEALAAGTPVVATEAGGMNEMVIDGETGLLVGNRDPEGLSSAIVRAISEPEGAAARARAGRALVERRFTVDAMVAGTVRLYEEVLSIPRK